MERFDVLVSAAPAPEQTAIDDPGFKGAVANLQRLTGDDLTLVNEEIVAAMRSPVAMIPDLAGHLVQAGGKRLRPMLTLAAARAFDYKGDSHVKLAAAVELIHAATLLHDDVVDASALRRGLETANVIWGNKESVLVGDFIFSRAFELMVEAGDLCVLQILSSASGVIAEGEVLQLATQKNLNATFEMYLAVVESKTAALFAAAAQAGAVIAGADGDASEAFRRYARNLGIAYQLVDDALDYSGYEAALGKRVGDDFREGKMTLPIVYALQRATDEEKAFWRRTISEGRQNGDDLAAARAALERTGAIDDTIACARRFADQALIDLERAPQNVYSHALAELAAASVNRGY
ncbi:MAG: polyprenyl synthetase family protein [Alphaproteobacteria bacterium]|nr:polyprenyl synthetase family protein [Alphaproteobacteria bacterium]